ncbi:mucin-2 [Numida meleagris]|uniref:mucin-2 n=1 Tax=Numida meleagris TaxID=8996 RepID=UPI000B3D8CB9|nr:mucin-2 [Numida meleagris]
MSCLVTTCSEVKMAGRTRNHGHYVCSTWGNNHFKTFDGDIYQFPGLCEYNFVSDCQDSYREFSVHIQRALNSNNHPEIQYILITIADFTVYLKPKLAVVDGRIVRTPYYSSGLLIESNDVYTKVYAKLGLILIWNQEDALMVELDSKFGNQTCGLCGDYNGVPIYNEFISGTASYNSITYGNLQKISKPNDECEDPDETRALPSCNEHRDECEKLLTSSAFADCQSRLNLEMYIQACMQDKCACKGNEDSFCLCSTISEYSRQCSHAGGRPGEWRTEDFCFKTCPGNMVYRESSSPCMDTCSHLEISSLCEEHYMDGCFCPEGTVYDDVTEKGCIPVSQCYCRLHGKGYSPGETITNECEECTCDSGRWTCKDLPCPGTCSVQGGSHITTFDGKKYTFHGDCYYVLAKSAVNNNHALLAELAPCGSTDGQTCLKTVVLLVDDKKNVVVFRSDGSVSLNEMTVNVPHVSASFSVFKPSSYYLIVQTSFGLHLQIQLSPVMQLFVTADQSVQDLQGLCGNFNGMEGDDFKTTNGLVEATGSAFANTWKAQSTCADQVEKLEDPCSLSIESENYAEHWCSLLKNTEGPFARCHSVVDPAEYYKQCKYDTCLCKDNEECLCAALSSYSRACAFKGIILGGWRQSVCSDEVSACPGNQIFHYNLTMCQQTCRSITDGEKYCLQDFAPVDGCGCPDNTYLDNQDTCVPISKCPCYYKGSYLEPGEYVTKDGERCVCRNAKVQCTSVTMRMKSITECTSNKTYFDCNASPDWTSRTPVQLRCGTSQIDLYQGECVSGCVCPEGLFDDGRGGCVEEEDCPCIHNSDWYNHGQSITVDCNTCTCQKGIWSCTENVCYGTCMIYGSGHYITFDGKFYDFDGSCEYVATQDYCGDKNSGGSFSIITENVPCGTTGVTCSKAIKMFIGKTELKLENKDYKEIQRDIGDDVYYQNRTVGLYLVIEASNGLMLIWDKKTTVFIKLTPDYKGKVCGLCGNFDDKSSNDFTSRSGLQETSALAFGNSWKQSSVCPDVTEEIKPCDLKPHRKSWAEKECSLILSEIFKICHSKVNPSPFYDACVHDACSCDSGGDCDCFCSAVAAYAQECTKAQACVFWRSPDICPIFCDYYNPRNECEWHYEPCGSNVMTCRMIYNVSTNFSVPYLEGCYPRCPHEKPVYNEETNECVAADECWCYHNGNPVIIGGEIPTEENCTKCICRPSGSIECTPIPGCPCVINGTSYDVGETVATVTEGDMCTTYVCAENGSLVPGITYPCPSTTSPSTISTSPGTSTLTTIVTTSPPVTTTPCLGLICDWSEWFDVSNPEEDGGDYETYDAIRIEHGNKICKAPEDIECRAKDSPDKTLEELGQKVECNVTYGLICKNEEQDASIWHLCYNYEIRVNCCEWHEIPCETTSTPSSTPTASSVTTGTTVPTTTTQQSTTITTIPTPTATTTSQPTPSVTTPLTSASTVSTTAPTPTPSESPTSTATTTPFSSSTQGTTPTVPGTSASTPTVTTTVLPTIGTQTQPHPSTLPLKNCDCIWTDWIDMSQPDISDMNSGDYESITEINNNSWVCVKAENISCRAKDYPNISLEELGQKVECNVNTGLICNNKDQENNGNISYCHNYEINVCCTPNKTECIPTTELTTTISTPVLYSTTTTIVFTSTVSSTAPTPTPTISPTSTTSGTMLTSTTSSSTGSTTSVTGPPSSISTTVSPSTPTPTPTTSVTTAPTTTEVQCTFPPEDCIWTDWIDVSYPHYGPENGDDETFETIQNKLPSWNCTKVENISCRAEKFPDVPIEDLGQKRNREIKRKCNCFPTVMEPCVFSGPTSQSTTGTTVSSTTSTTVSSTTPTPTPTGTAPTTTSGTTPSSSTSSSTVSTTTVTGPPPSIPTTVSPSTPTPTPTTSVSTPPTTTEGNCLVLLLCTCLYHGAFPKCLLTAILKEPAFRPVAWTHVKVGNAVGEKWLCKNKYGTFGTEVPTTVREGSSTASVSTPISTQTAGSTSPPSVSTIPSTVTTSGTTPTKSFTTTSGTTSSSSSTVTATTITTSEIVSSGSASTSGTTPTSSTVTVSGSSTYSTVTTLSTLSSTASSGSNCTISPNETYAPGESFWLCNCTEAICVENNTIVLVPVICEPPPKPTCSNGLAPVQVMDDDLCCWHWECDCYCTGWGDPHYMTFDGLYYSYQGNCTYVLVEEIEKTVDNFGVYIDNYHCDTRDVVSCPRALIVRHETQEVRIVTVKPNTVEVEVTVNKQAVALPYKKFGLSIYESGINRVVEIPELKMNVTFNGLSFSIRMPYSLFGNNTQGQCGICNNNTADDCRLPNGNIAESCETMADHWQVVDLSKPQCSPGLIPTKAPSTTAGQPCKESSLCELLWGSVFEKCHEVVKPDRYYAACVFDSCTLPDLDLECSSLQIYAAICADQNVCIDWRSHTNGVCSYECPKHKEYRACGPIRETTCKSSAQNETSVKQVEGCFCPNGTMLFDSGVDVCVNTCGCVGFDMIPREFGEKFTADCQDCICLEGGNGIVCEPHKCPEQNKRSCSGKGFYEVIEVNPEDPCCPIVTCKCNTSLCTTQPPKCTLGFEVHSYIPSDECCPVYQCVPKKVCVHQNAEFLPNSSVFVDKCHSCYCTNEVNISTQLNVISCEHIPCDTYCEPGYERQHVEGECCGKCVQTKCIVHTSHGSSLILNPGEFKNDPYNNCTIYSCTSFKNQLISSTSEITCPAFNEESCKPGTVTFLPNGCCKTCVPLDSPTPCSVRERKDFIVYKKCRSLERVVLTECEGKCGTFSLYSAEASSMEHSCSCCKEVKTSMKEVELKCPSGHSITHKYMYVESCGCQDTQCEVPESSESHSTEESNESTQNHRKRAISLTSK